MLKTAFALIGIVALAGVFLFLLGWVIGSALHNINKHDETIRNTASSLWRDKQ